MKKVFVVNNAGFDLSDAKNYGTLVIMSEDTIDKYDVRTMYRQMRQFLKNSEPEDFILQSGPSVMCMVASAIFSSMHDRLNLLLWLEDQPQSRYLVRTLVFTD